LKEKIEINEAYNGNGMNSDSQGENDYEHENFEQVESHGNISGIENMGGDERAHEISN
jgi:hypothetical protein